MGYLYSAFGFVLKLIYDIVSNYGLSIILLTLLIKIIVLPLTLKQQKAMTKMQRIQPKLQEIQEKYKDDKEKASQETMKLYKEYGVNPMGGCLPLLIQFPILIAFYQVIQKPVQYMLSMPVKEIKALCETCGIDFKTSGAQILLAKELDKINFDFFGIDLSAVPWDQIKAFMAGKTGIIALVAIIIPALACFTTYLTSKVSSSVNQTKKEEAAKNQKKKRVLSPDEKTSNANSGESMTKSMTYMMPIMTLFFTFTLPAAMGLYWTVSNVFAIVQTVLLNGYYNKKLAVEIEAQDMIREEKIQEKMKKYNMKKKRG